MSGGVFRDAGAAIERVAVLEQEKDDLETELAKLRAELDEVRDDEASKRRPDDVAKLQVELAAARKKFKKELAAARKKFEKELAAAQRQIEELGGKLDSATRVEPEKVIVTKVPENLDAYMQRVQDERDELRKEVSALREAASRAPKPSLFATLFGRR